MLDLEISLLQDDVRCAWIREKSLPGERSEDCDGFAGKYFTLGSLKPLKGKDLYLMVRLCAKFRGIKEEVENDNQLAEDFLFDAEQRIKVVSNLASSFSPVTQVLSCLQRN